ncbi:hypothetical protein ACFO0N_00350 [Halobium salinum]|uniref:DUF7513 domain-containing protein n=1 Tax=Halobium salinum TaxID=1364940 RepID=A0ABD5P6U5_9EURY|nr:hypothetical protein [Halobium salinum]
MSSPLEKFLAGWSFRTRTPAYAAGDELVAFVTGREGDALVVRIGDTRLLIPEGDSGLVDQRVKLRVTSFDTDAHRGEAEVLERYELQDDD